MSKVNISLVGGQPMPIYVGIDATGPDKTVLVHSIQSASDAKIIASNTNKESELILFSDVDYPKIKSSTRALLEQYLEDEVFVNVSGGPKPWAIAFAKESFSKKNITLFYIDQNNHFINLNEGKIQWLDLQLDINTILKYNHTSVSNHSEINIYNEEDWEALSQLREFRRKFPKDFYNLTGTEGYSISFSGKTEKRKSKRVGSELIIDRNANEVTFSGFNNRGRAYEYIFSSPHICEMVLNAHWFELEVARIIKKWPSTKELWINVKFPYFDGKAKNEIDIIVSNGSKLLFVECKTQIYNTTDIDKFRTAVKNYGGTASKALFVTNSKVMKPEAIQKCQDSKIKTFTMGDTIDAKKAQSLYSIVDEEMRSTNER